MPNPFIFDEINRISAACREDIALALEERELCIVNDLSPAMAPFAWILAHGVLKTGLVARVHLVKAIPMTPVEESLFAESKSLTLSDAFPREGDTPWVMLYLSDDPSPATLLAPALKAFTQLTDSIFLFAPILGTMAPFPTGAKALAEGELTLLLAERPEDSPEGRLFLREELLRALLAKAAYDLREVRIPGLYGPGLTPPDHMKLTELLEMGKNNGILAAENSRRVDSFASVTQAALSVFKVMAEGKPGSVYHSLSSPAETGDIAYLLNRSYFQNALSLGIKAGKKEATYHALSFHKLSALFQALPQADLEDEIYRTACALSGASDYDVTRRLETYDGKLAALQSLQTEMLLEVDRICRENGISYFLVSGNLLGGVRHGGPIPWDDDVDIAMLREDYERFREICPDALSEKYEYASRYFDREYGYIFDKIRLKDSIFSTEYSSHFEGLSDGVFLDVFVYDKTSSSPKMQKLHVKLLRLLARASYVRWWNDPEGIRHSWALPLLRLFPLGFYHRLLDFAATFYRKKDTGFLLDSLGYYLFKGAFPAEWFDEVWEIPYGGANLPVPRGYDEFLRFLYGRDYIQKPPISKRLSGHSLARLDLGPHMPGLSGSLVCDREGELYPIQRAKTDEKVLDKTEAL